MIETDSEGFVSGDLEIPEGEFAVWGVVGTNTPSITTATSDTLQAHANPDHAEDLEELYSRTMRYAITEPEVVHYCICRIDGTNRFHFFERYASRVAFEAHIQRPLTYELFSRDLMRGCTDVAFAVPGSMPAPRDSMSVNDVGEVDNGKYQAYLNQLGPLPDDEFAIYGTVSKRLRLVDSVNVLLMAPGSNQYRTQ